MLKDKLKQYIGAKVPIIYVNSFDDNEVEKEKSGSGTRCGDLRIEKK